MEITFEDTDPTVELATQTDEIIQITLFSYLRWFLPRDIPRSSESPIKRRVLTLKREGNKFKMAIHLTGLGKITCSFLDADPSNKEKPLVFGIPL